MPRYQPQEVPTEDELHGEPGSGQLVRYFPRRPRLIPAGPREPAVSYADWIRAVGQRGR